MYVQGSDDILCFLGVLIGRKSTFLILSVRVSLPHRNVASVSVET